MDGADASAGEHRLDRLRDHRHVNQHAVARLHAKIRKHGRKRCGLVEKLAIGQRALRICDGTVVEKRGLIAASRFHMAVERVVAGVQPPVRKPAAIDPRVGVEDRLRRLDP